MHNGPSSNPTTAIDEMPLALSYRYHTFFGKEQVINLSAPVLPARGTATVLVTGKPDARGMEQKLLARARELLKQRKANARQPEPGVIPGYVHDLAHAPEPVEPEVVVAAPVVTRTLPKPPRPPLPVPRLPPRAGR